jgi:long-chain acyl-CoA synthetase
MSNNVESEVSVDAGDNVLAALHERARTHPTDPALLVVSNGSVETLSAADVLARVRTLAAGLVGAGVGAGDRVAIFSHARVEWALVDYAIWQAGAVGVTIYETSAPDQVRWILQNSGATVVVVENSALADVVEQVRPDVTGLGQVFVIDDGGLDELDQLGTHVTEAELDARAASIGHDSIATLVYTSGTTGRPKGCALSHYNIIWTIRQIISAEPELVGPSNRTLTFLPLAHVLARVVQLTAVTAGVPVAFGGGMRTMLGDLATVKPTWLTVVPRVLEKVHDGAAQKAGSGPQRRVFDWADRVARDMGAHRSAGTSPPWHLRASHRLADALVYRNIRSVMGGELRYVISGGAPLHEDLGRFFGGIGVEVLEGYGLTETTGPATVHRVGHSRPGTVGPPLPGVGVRIADNGEIQLSGGVIFQGYWANDEATAEVFDDGWFRTGDIGEIDSDGHLLITGRMKDLIVTAGGKNIAPAILEVGVAAHPLVSHAVIVGDDRRFVSALLTLDLQNLGAWAHQHGKHVSSPGHLVVELADDPDLLAELQTAIDQVNEQMSQAEGIRAFRVLTGDFTVESGELTPTMKVKRSTVIARRAAVVESIYARAD